MKIIPGIGTIATVSFVVYVFLADSPQERLDRTCKPIVWGGDMIHSIAGAFNSSASTLASISKYTLKFNNKCEEATWSFFYKDDYMKSLEEYQREKQIEIEEERRKLQQSLQKKEQEKQIRQTQRSLTID